MTAELRVPKLNNNDATYILTEWLAEDGQLVDTGDPVAVIETSKAAEEIPAESGGYLWRALPVNADCAPGQALAYLTTEPIAPAAPEPASPSGSLSGSPSGSATGSASGSPSGLASAVSASVSGSAEALPVITAPAQELLDELGIPVERVRTLGLKVIRRADVERLAAAPAVSLYELPKVQRAVARAVQVSHQGIPAAYTVMTMDVGETLAAAARLTREVRRPVGLAELFTVAVAGLHGEFPLFFATLVDDRNARLSETPNIGITVDVGEGLYVPVIHDAGSRSLKEIATRLMEFRLAATTGEFREADLSGGNIAITLHTDADISLAIPFVFPGHACALAITAPQPVLTLADGQPVTRTIANIGLAYDHRLINGRDAALFLRALRDAITSVSAPDVR
ncbi:2-oxo acid dehydrogenase subunit E2 [Acrocarpospora catenulata]|uniref:2-oxo acid dehydrogenase subunit E2 n=1 Tax=Acrocarpospora catenulata TaxID=2836182 RepID=UPI001BDAC68F|nr:2-oxo acid dehydrogenase subunit E2 [Acrocarpospora catenulata]